MITEKQRDVLFFIAAFVVKNRYAPSYQDISTGLGYKSKTTIYMMVRSLEKRGFIKTEKYSARSFCLTPAGVSWIGETQT